MSDLFMKLFGTIDWNLVWVSIFGTVFIVTSLILAIKFPTPSPFQLFIFRSVFGLSAAGTAATIPGFLSINIGTSATAGLKAGGAIAVFLLIYRFNPAKLAEPPTNPDLKSKNIFHVIVKGWNNTLTLVEADVHEKMNQIVIESRSADKNFICQKVNG